MNDLIQRFDKLEKEFQSINIQSIPDDNLANIFYQIVGTSLDIMDTNRKILKGGFECPLENPQ